LTASDEDKERMIRKITAFLQDWSEACEYAKECAPDLSVLIKDKEFLDLLLTLAVVAGFWLLSLRPARRPRLFVPNEDDRAPHDPSRKQAIAGLGADGLVLGFVTTISALAQVTGIRFFLFPEIGALSCEVLRRPNGAWARAPSMLVLTPFFTGLVGTLTTNFFPYGVFAIVINIICATAIIRLLKSPITPAISAGLLPLTLGDASWWYPPSLLVGTGLLAGASMLSRRLEAGHEEQLTSGAEAHSDASGQHDSSWIPFLSAFFLLAACSASLSGMRFLLYPPLAVIAVEMFAHASVCPWAQRPLLLPVACGLMIIVGLFIVEWLGTGAAATALTIALGLGVLRLLALHAPPALAVGLLAFVVPQPDLRYALAVVLGTALLTLVFLLWRKTQAPL
jgi:hypothetical protein